MPTNMQAAIMPASGADLVVDRMEVPTPRAGEVLVRVEACGFVQNLANVFKARAAGGDGMSYPRTPAVFGLDVAGAIQSVDALATDFAPGDRVYVNPGLSCGGCKACRNDRPIDCERFALRGYFGIGEKSQKLLDDYSQGGFAQFIAVPQRSLVRLPDNLGFDAATRLGYLGTAFRALMRADCGPGKTVLINGATGTLGLGAVILALALGAERVLGVARGEELLRRIRALSPEGRVVTLSSDEQDTDAWAREATDGRGVDIVIDALGGGAPPEPTRQAFFALKRGGCMVNIGAVKDDVPLNLFWALSNNISVLGSTWFTTGEGQRMADMVGQGLLDLSIFEQHGYPLSAINEAIADTDNRQGGFSNYVIHPWRDG